MNVATGTPDPIFHEAPTALDTPLEVIAGEVPTDLRGAFVRNGPGVFHAGNDSFHFLDGHAFVASVTFEPGHAPHLRGRLVDTPVRSAEVAANRQTTRRPFTNLPKRWSNFFNVKFGNNAAHDVYVWGDGIVVTDAPGHFLLDSTTLETRGPAPANRLLRAGNGSISPMPRFDASHDRLVIYDGKPGAIGNDEIAFHELDRQWNTVKRVARTLPGKGLFVHDLAFSEKYYVVLEFGRLRLGTLLGGSVAPIEAITFAPTDSLRVFAIPREGDGPVLSAALPMGHEAFHLFNAFDAEDGTLVFDACVYGARVDFRALYPNAIRDRAPAPGPSTPPTPTRFVFDLAKGTIAASPMPGIHGDAPDVNPAFHGRKHRFGYVAAKTSAGRETDPNGFFWFHGVGKIDFDTKSAETWDAGPEVTCSAPAFVPRPGATAEDDGWLLVWLLDAASQRSDVAIFDARALASGPIARLKGPAMLPGVSHTAFWAR